MQEEAEAKAAAAERHARQLQLSLKQAETELQQQGADAQLDGHAATLRLSDLQHLYTRSSLLRNPQNTAACDPLNGCFKARRVYRTRPSVRHLPTMQFCTRLRDRALPSPTSWVLILPVNSLVDCVKEDLHNQGVVTKLSARVSDAIRL